jgi:hypothetical protein
LPAALAGGKWREYTIDSLHSNVFTNVDHCELEKTDSGQLDKASFNYDRVMLPSAVVLLELVAS